MRHFRLIELYQIVNLFRVTIFAVAWMLTTGSTLANPTSLNSKLKLTQEEIAWLDQHPVVSVAYDEHYPPYSLLNEQGEPIGLSVDVFNLLSDYLGIEFEFYPKTEWNALYEDAKNHKVDLVATMVKRPDRTEWFNFTVPYTFKSLVIMTRDDEYLFSEQDLRGKTVALVKGYESTDRVLAEYPSIRPRLVDTTLDALHAVSVGNADAAITFIGAGHYLRAKHMLNNLEFAALYQDSMTPEGIAVRKDWPELHSILNKALKALPESQMQELRAKWLPTDDIASFQPIDLTDAEKAWIEEHPIIRLGIDPEFAPFEFVEDGTYSGMTSDYIRLINERLGINMQIVEGLTWEEVIAQSKTGGIDVLPVVGLTKERQQYLSYTEPYLSFHRIILTRTNHPFINSLDDITHLRVAVQKDSSHDGFLQEESKIKPLTYDSLQEALMAVSNGEADAFVGNVASATYWVRKLNLANLKVAAPADREVISLHFAVRKDWPELVSIIQKGLDSIGVQQRRKISQKWMLLQYDPITDYTLILKTSLIALAILGAVIAWGVTLKKMVIKRTQELKEALTQAKQANIAKSNFLNTVSHELRTPMNGIIGAAQLLDTPTLPDEQRREFVGIIHKSGNKLITLIEQMLDFSTLGTGKLILQDTPFNAYKLLKMSQEAHQEVAEEKNLSLNYTWQSDANQQYIGDVQYIHKALSSLVDNAIKFTETGYVEVEGKELERDAKSALLQFSVSDSGIGIKASDQENIFETFHMIDGSMTRQHEGTGLGLSLAHQLITQMGGKITVESTPEVGSRFQITLRLPLAD